MTTIKFERFERVCGHNKTARENGELSRIIYDWKVLIDGEYRAKLERYSGSSQGYTVQDVDGDPIDPPAKGYRIGRRIPNQSLFVTVIEDMLANELIPTLEQIEAKRAEKQAKIDKRKAEQAEQYRLNTIQQAGTFLYAALKLAQAEIHNPGAARANGIDIVDVIEQAFKQAEWKEHRTPELIEYEARHC